MRSLNRSRVSISYFSYVYLSRLFRLPASFSSAEECGEQCIAVPCHDILAALVACVYVLVSFVCLLHLFRLGGRSVLCGSI